MNCLRLIVQIVVSNVSRGALAQALGTEQLRMLATRFSIWSFAFLAASMIANAQFKEVGPPPYSPTVARQHIRTLLEKIDASNRQKTVETLSGLLSWYRDILDEEMIAAWQKDTRANLTDLMQSLADSRVASAIVEFSWREQRQAAFNLTYAPLLGNLMARFPESAQPFLDDLLGPIASGRQTPDLRQPEAEAVCRILLDMPDIGTWRKTALQILPHYRRVAESLLVRDLHGSDQEKSYQAQLWLNELKGDAPATASERQSPRRRPMPSRSAVDDSTPTGDQTASVAPLPRASADRQPTPAAPNSAPPRSPVPAAAVPSTTQPYNGAKSGTFECGGSPIPQNAEYVFRNVPLVKMQLDYDTKIWDARLAPGDGQTQRLIVRNKSSGPQKRCVVHWSVIP
jgi:hypothetical protein